MKWATSERAMRRRVLAGSVPASAGCAGVRLRSSNEVRVRLRLVTLDLSLLKIRRVEVKVAYDIAFCKFNTVRRVCRIYRRVVVIGAH